MRSDNRTTQNDLSKNKAGAKIFLFSNARDEDRSPPSMTI
jgi:hypothetical protein